MSSFAGAARLRGVSLEGVRQTRGAQPVQNHAAATIGVDHVGLTVADLDRSRRFFVECLAGRWWVRNRTTRLCSFPTG